MTDIKSKPGEIDASAEENAEAANPLTTDQSASGAARDVELVTFVEYLFFAYRDFTGDADDLLHDIGYGRAHHRVVHFVARHPGVRVADLLEILRITKQSLARVLKQLIDDEYIEQQSGTSDRRERHLYLTQKGLNLTDKLTKLQCARIGHALEIIKPANQNVVKDFLEAMISEKDRPSVIDLVDKANRNELSNSGES